MNKILFPFEPENSIYKEAYIYAVKFARNLDAELIMLNVFSIDNYDDNITANNYQKILKKKWLKAYDEVIHLNNYYIQCHANLESDLKIRFDHRFIHGTPQQEIRNILKNEEIDLIVLPVSDKQEANKKIVGIIRDEIFEKNNTSLLVIPLNKNFEEINNVVFATDLKKLNLPILYFRDILKYANIFNAAINFLHITKTKDSVLPEDIEGYRLIMEIIKKNNKHQFKTIFGEKIGEALNDYNSINKINLLSVVKHHHFFLDNLFHKSVSEEISFKSNVPVLVLREKQ